jgi:Spy/CpxP family protein refolding chaperone
MKAITRNKWFLALLAVLLLGNIALLLSFFVFGERQDGKGGRTDAPEKGYLARQLKLDEAQEKQFRELKESFFKEMGPVWEDIRITKDSFYRQLNNASFSDSDIAAYAQRIAEKNRVADERMFRHFRELRAYCTPQQQQTFDTLVPRMLSRSGRRGDSQRK